MLSVRLIEGKGNGVFTDSAIRKGDIIEECPILILSLEDIALLEQTILDNYVFSWGSGSCVLFGYGMVYNHSDNPNAVADEDMAKQRMVFRACRDIAEGVEITHEYSGENRPIIFSGPTWEFADKREKS